jgi:hypothetical protein
LAGGASDTWNAHLWLLLLLLQLLLKHLLLLLSFKQLLLQLLFLLLLLQLLHIGSSWLRSYHVSNHWRHAHRCDWHQVFSCSRVLWL